jgi:hypothetical protein
LPLYIKQRIIKSFVTGLGNNCDSLKYLKQDIRETIGIKLKESVFVVQKMLNFRIPCVEKL